MIAAAVVNAAVSPPVDNPTFRSVILAQPRATSRATGVPCSRIGAKLRAGHRLFDRRQRGIGLAAIGAAGLRHVGPAAATFAAERL
jgi:hypothetical protein